MASRWSAPALLAMSVALLCGTITEAAAQQVRWRVSGSLTAAHSTSRAMETFKKEVARLTNNEVQLDLFPGNTLGGAFEQVDQIRTGQIQMAWAGLPFYDKLSPDLGAAVLPFGAATAKQAVCQIEGDFGRYLEERTAEKGVYLLGWMTMGARHVTNNKRPIKTVDDIKGLKIRTPSGEAWDLTFRALGANPTPIDIKELYQALQQGVVDGQENPYDNMLVRKFYEVQKHVSNTGHFNDWAGVFVNKAAFDKLTPAHQKAMRTALATAVAEQRQISEREISTALAGLVKGGMVYTEITPAELAKFREATKPVYAQMRAKLGDKVMDLAEAAIKRCQ